MSKVRDAIEDLRSIATVDDAQTYTADQSHADNVKAKFGAGDDLQIYHDGNNSYIKDSGTGNVNFLVNDLKIRNAAGNQDMLQVIDGADVRLNFAGVNKLATTSTGVDVTGEITADGLALGDAQKATFGASDDLQIYHDGLNSYVSDVGTGNLVLRGANIEMYDGAGDTLMFNANNNGGVGLHYAGSAKLATTSTGIDVTGEVTTDTITQVTTNALDLLPISATITDTAVDVFVYDTSKDSDGGQWRKRTQGTSWHNETLNTSTRGSRKEFPAVAVIVTQNMNQYESRVTIYDGDDPAMPMWMVFNSSSNTKFLLGNLRLVTSLSMLNGTLCMGSKAASDGRLYLISFITDEAISSYEASSTFNTIMPIGDRDTAPILRAIDKAYTLVSTAINDIAMTVLPNAPVDSATGLPIPTIAVATDGGVSVIKDDGSVVDITDGTYPPFMNVDFDGKHILYVGHREYNNVGSFYLNAIRDLPTSDIDIDSIAREYRTTRSLLSQNGITLLGGVTGIANGHIGGNDGVTLVDHNYDNVSLSSANYITSDYNTGYMVGDIKLAALSDTDATNVVGTELVTNGTFDSDTSWTKGTGWTISGGTAVATNVVSGVALQQNITISVAGTYTFSVDIVDTASTYSVTCGTLGTGAISTTGVVTMTGYLAAGTHSVHVGAWSSGFSGTVDNFSVRLADSDRSVNANGLAVHGTITKSAVATGADLVAYSGFSASNYLRQPYNSDLEFGLNDFNVMFWVKEAPTSAVELVMEHRDGSGGYSYNTLIRADGTLQFTLSAATGISLFTPVAIDDSKWHFISFTRVSGILYGYLDGVLFGSIAANINADNATAVTTIGRGSWTSNPTTASLALFRISATAPTAAQIKTIYEAEKPLFQENAQATLYGTSDAVTALAHDDSTNLLHVGTSSGRSVFQGLRRVDNTTTAVGAAISASNGLVVED